MLTPNEGCGQLPEDRTAGSGTFFRPHAPGNQGKTSQQPPTEFGISLLIQGCEQYPGRSNSIYLCYSIIQ
jgi:hypothetical protein